MRKGRSKQLLLLALLISTMGLTLGFAAFSNYLSISSSATVTPDSSDFKIVIYGTPNRGAVDGEMLFTSTTLSVPDYTSTELVPSVAKIDNDKLEISNISALVRNNIDRVGYFFRIKNEGEYDAYFDWNFVEGSNNSDPKTISPSSCVAAEGANQDLVTSVCSSIFQYVYAYDSNDSLLMNGAHVLTKGDYIDLVIEIGFGGTVKPDADLTATFENIKLDFSTVG